MHASMQLELTPPIRKHAAGTYTAGPQACSWGELATADAAERQAVPLNSSLILADTLAETSVVQQCPSLGLWEQNLLSTSSRM